MATRTTYGLSNGGGVINTIIHKLSLYNHTQYHFIELSLAIYLYACGDLRTPEVTGFFPEMIALQHM